MINLTTSIKDAFFNRNCFAPHYSLLNTFFLQDKIGALHEAKTRAVGIRCLQLHQTYGFTYEMLYESLKEIFSLPNQIKLSEQIDLSNFDIFKKSLDSLLANYDAPIEYKIIKQNVA